MILSLLSELRDFASSFLEKVGRFIRAVVGALRPAGSEIRAQTRTLVAQKTPPAARIAAFARVILGLAALAVLLIILATLPFALTAALLVLLVVGVICVFFAVVYVIYKIPDWIVQLLGGEAKSRADKFAFALAAFGISIVLGWMIDLALNPPKPTPYQIQLTATQAYYDAVQELPDCGRITELNAIAASITGRHDFEPPSADSCFETWEAPTPAVTPAACSADQVNTLRRTIAAFKRDIPADLSPRNVQAWYDQYKTRIYPSIPDCEAALAPKRLMVYLADEVLSIALLTDRQMSTEIHEQMKADLEQQLTAFQ